MRHRKQAREKRALGEEGGREGGEGERRKRREVEARAVVGRCERRGGGLVSRDNRRRGANQPRIRKAASCCSRVVCVASRVYRVPRYRGKDAYAYHLYYVASQRLALSPHPSPLFNRSTRLIAREQSAFLPSRSLIVDRG